jgi:hypothetical protein
MKQIPAIRMLVSAVVLIVVAAGCGDDSVAPKMQAPAPLVQFSIDLNADVVVNNGTGALDDTQESVDDTTQGIYANYAYVTQSAAQEVYPADPDGLPDDAFFPANDDHPDVQLAYRNNSDGYNARRIMANNESYSIDTGGEKFSELHVFMAAGQGNVDVQINLDYENLGVVSNAVVPDWFNEVPSTGSTYYLIDGMDRIKRTAGTFDNRDDAAIFGFDVGVDSTYALESVTIRRSAGNSTGSVLVLFGAVGVRAKGDAPPSK